jgi:hypothetical protein
MTKYNPKRDLPDFAREFKTLSPSKLAEIVLNRRNKKVTSESVTMWFKRHPEVYNVLVKELVEGLPTEKEAVDVSIFQNGQFENLESVKNWIAEMKDRDIVNVSGWVNAVKRVCMGKFPKLGLDLVASGEWCLKHPNRLQLDDVIALVRILKSKGFETSSIRVPLRSFLLSKGIIVGKKISGAKSRGCGKFATLFVEMDVLNKMLAWIKTQDYEAYVIDKFMLKTATRITATLKATIKLPNGMQNIREFSDHAEIKVYDKARHSIYPEGKEWTKHIDFVLLQDLKTIIGDRKEGKIFSKTADEMNKINREALKRFCPELEPHIPMSNHFWRHMFAQLMLRLTDWNYGVVAELGGWTVKALEESYGKPPQAVVKSWGLKYMPMIKINVNETLAEIMPIQILEQPSLEV